MSEQPYPYRDGWVGVGDDPKAYGVYLVEIDAGRVYRLATFRVEVIDSRGARTQYEDAILNDLNDISKIDIFSRKATKSGISVQVAMNRLPLDEIRRTGVVLQNCVVDVYWGIAGKDHTIDQAIHVLNGTMSAPVVNEVAGRVSFRVQERRVLRDRPFPPVVAVDSVIAAIDPEALGKAYPIVIGTVGKTTAFSIDDPTNEKFLVAADPNGEFSGAPVTAVYEGDDPMAGEPAGQGRESDTAGNAYWYFTTAGGGGPTGKDVTVDFTGSSEDSFAEAVRYLIQNFSDYTSTIDLDSLRTLDTEVRNITMAMIVNQQSSNGVIDFIRSRMLKQVPVVMWQTGGKYQFKSLWWNRNIVKRLSFDKNILLKKSAPAETPLSGIYNSFTVNYAMSGFRGDNQGCLVRDWDSDALCKESANRYGKRYMPPFSAPDVADGNGAVMIMHWLVETFSRMRVFVSYVCTSDVVDVHLLDTVEVFDEFEGWTHGPLFRVVGISRFTGPQIILDLVSVDDYTDVYRIN